MPKRLGDIGSSATRMTRLHTTFEASLADYEKKDAFEETMCQLNVRLFRCENELAATRQSVRLRESKRKELSKSSSVDEVLSFSFSEKDLETW